VLVVALELEARLQLLGSPLQSLATSGSQPPPPSSWRRTWDRTAADRRRRRRRGSRRRRTGTPRSRRFKGGGAGAMRGGGVVAGVAPDLGAIAAQPCSSLTPLRPPQLPRANEAAPATRRRGRLRRPPPPPPRLGERAYQPPRRHLTAALTPTTANPSGGATRQKDFKSEDENRTKGRSKQKDT
jgi:hypothetical protein